METEFRSFNKILHINKLQMSITQKIHGSNAQIAIFSDENGELKLQCGNRSRWITIDNDNYGFAQFCEERKDNFIKLLGVGRHFGEWCGKGINSGEGLDQKVLALFDWRRWTGKTLPDRVTTVPMLYNGTISLQAINNAMENLKVNGSRLVPGFMKPEGVVIEIDGQFYKNVFDNEEVKWKESAALKGAANDVDISYLLQPLRLEKLLSRDEKYLREYPKSLGSICSDYVSDLESESQFECRDSDELKLHKKALGKQIFYFIKSIVNARAV